MDAGTLIFEVDNRAYRIHLTDEHAPNTLSALKTTLPMTADIHCAKIAGCHIMWPVPFVARLENAVDVMTMAPGSFFFWPERQYLEITYDELQAESAPISYLGQMEGEISWLRDYADTNRREQGQKLFTAQLYMEAQKGPVSAEPAAIGDDSWARLRAARQAAWAKPPADIQRLLDREGLMIPYGPLSMAEGELRKLHELLWRLWNDQTRYANSQKKDIAIFAIEAAISRVAGFCHMNDVGAALEDGMVCIDQGVVELESVLAELVLYSGRMAAWLDLRICWWPMNEITKNARAKWPDG